LHKIYVLQKTSTGNNFCPTEKRAGNFALLPPPPSELARQGRASAARRIESDPAQLGAYAGKTGLFVGAAAREERANAQRVAESIGPGLARLGEAEGSSARDYRSHVERQLQADATGAPKLSERAQAAIGVVRAAKTDKERADAWKVPANFTILWTCRRAGWRGRLHIGDRDGTNVPPRWLVNGALERKEH